MSKKEAVLAIFIVLIVLLAGVSHAAQQQQKSFWQKFKDAVKSILYWSPEQLASIYADALEANSQSLVVIDENGNKVVVIENGKPIIVVKDGTGQVVFTDKNGKQVEVNGVSRLSDIMKASDSLPTPEEKASHLKQVLIAAGGQKIVERTELIEIGKPADASQVAKDFFPGVVEKAAAAEQAKKAEEDDAYVVQQKAIAEAKQKYSEHLKSIRVEFGDVDIDTGDYSNTKALPDLIDQEFVKAIELWETGAESSESVRVYYSNGGKTKTVVYPGGLMSTYTKTEDGRWNLVSEADSIVPILEEITTPLDPSIYDDLAGYTPLPESKPFKLIHQSLNGIRIWQQRNVFIKLPRESSDVVVSHMDVPTAIQLMMQGHPIEVSSTGKVQQLFAFNKDGSFEYEDAYGNLKKIKNAQFSSLESQNSIVKSKEESIVATLMKFVVEGKNEVNAIESVKIGLIVAPNRDLALAHFNTVDFKPSITQDATGVRYSYQIGNIGKVEVKYDSGNPLSQEPKYLRDPLEAFRGITAGPTSFYAETTDEKGVKTVYSVLYSPQDYLILTKTVTDRDGNILESTQRALDQPEPTAASSIQTIDSSGKKITVAEFKAVNEIGSYESLIIGLIEGSNGHELKGILGTGRQGVFGASAPKVYTDFDGSHTSIIGTSISNMRIMSIGADSGLTTGEFQGLSLFPSNLVAKLVENPTVGGGIIAPGGGQLQISGDSFYVKGTNVGEVKLDKVTYEVLEKKEITSFKVPGEVGFRGLAGEITVKATGYNNGQRYEAMFTVDDKSYVGIEHVGPFIHVFFVRPFGSTASQDETESIESTRQRIVEIEEARQLEFEQQLDISSVQQQIAIAEEEARQLHEFEAPTAVQVDFQQQEINFIPEENIPKVEGIDNVNILYLDKERPPSIAIYEPGALGDDPINLLNAIRHMVERKLNAEIIFFESKVPGFNGEAKLLENIFSARGFVTKSEPGKVVIVSFDYEIHDPQFTILEYTPLGVIAEVTGKTADGFPAKAVIGVRERPSETEIIMSQLFYVGPKVEAFKGIGGFQSTEVIYPEGVALSIPKGNPAYSLPSYPADPLYSLGAVSQGDGELNTPQGMVQVSGGNIRVIAWDGTQFDLFSVKRPAAGITTAQGLYNIVKESGITIAIASAAFYEGTNKDGFPTVLAVVLAKTEDAQKPYAVFAQQLLVDPQIEYDLEGGLASVILPSGTIIIPSAGEIPQTSVDAVKSIAKSQQDGGVFDGNQKVSLSLGTLRLVDVNDQIATLTNAKLRVVSEKTTPLIDPNLYYGSLEALPGQLAGDDPLFDRIVSNLLPQIEQRELIVKATGIDENDGQETQYTFLVSSASGKTTVQILEVAKGALSEPEVSSVSSSLTLSEPNPFSIFSPAPTFYPATEYRTYDFPEQQPPPRVCGDGVLNSPEQCESPNTNDNPFCVNNPIAMCIGRKTAIRDIYGKCNSRCSCEFDKPASTSCIKGFCGADCSNNNDCQSGTLCSRISCLCIAPPLNGLCGDGIVQSPNNDSINEQCDGDDDEILSDTGFCKTVRKCINCEWQAVLDTSDSQFELCDGLDNNCNSLIDENIQITPSQNEEGYCNKQVGVCYNSKKKCNGAKGFGECSIQEYNFTGQFQEIESVCDNLDNDCDGSIDEGCPCVINSTKSCGQNNLGVCKLGVQKCSDEGIWPLCRGAIFSEANKETLCNSIDDDCDGIVDENLKNRCGECGQLPEEVCDYKDNDCDAEMGSPTSASYYSAFYTNFSSPCPFGTICKGVYADGIDSNANGIIDEGIDEDVKTNPNGNYTNWCTGCTKIKRTCSKVLEEEFNKIYRKKDKSKLEEYIKGSEYFSCPPDDSDAVCCDNPSSCVYNGKCYANGSIEDIGNDGIMDMCIVESPGRWVVNYETNCTDGITNDADPLIDCQDPDCDGLQGPNGATCCHSATDCPQDDCIAESCANNECALTARNACDSAECPPDSYCNSTGGDCKTADESSNVCLSCAPDTTSMSWNSTSHIDAGKGYSNNTNVFNSLFNSDALPCPASSCSKSNCSCFDASNSIISHQSPITTGACCGDDSNEYFKKDYFAGECTTNSTDCVWPTGDSQKSNTGNAEWWCYLHEWAQCSNSSIGSKAGSSTCAGISGDNKWVIFPAPESQYSCTDLKDNDGDGAADCDDADCYSALQGKVTDGSGNPINGASVIVKKGGSQIASLTTSSQGNYNTSSLSCGNYQVSASHYEYSTQSRFFTVNALQQYDINIVLGAENSCEGDCTLAYDETIHASCGNINGCTFYDDKAKAICDFAKPGWVRDYNKTHYIVCASGSPEAKIESKASVSCASGTLVKITRIVLYNGEPVKLVVAACG